ncbi:MAG TPA: Gfo/Idh/MocA family oxidoreductase, partial [Thermodesulfobacteriota bacterium]|nr:Gfo/Idh/MocA family oxidoreductase [Thermodesulfobacteriota bacterium]
MNVAIIGAGNASLTLLDYFLSNPNVQVAGIADIREDAPGMVRAKELGVPTTYRMESLVQNPKIDL